MTSNELTKSNENLWPAPALSFAPNAIAAIERFVNLFMPEEPLLEMLEWLLVRDHQQTLQTARQLAMEAVSLYIEVKKETDTDWRLRLIGILGGTYPTKAREVIADQVICHQPYLKRRGRAGKKATYSVPVFEPIPRVGHAICRQVAPSLFDVEETDRGIKVCATADVERFKERQKDMFARSALYEVEVHNRPVHGVSVQWRISQSTPPCRIFVPDLVCKDVDDKLCDELAEDIENTFAFESRGMLGSYLGYLVQPQLAHYCPGQNPGYSFSGPTASGKNYTAEVLPSIVYFPKRGESVRKTNLGEEHREFEIFCYDCRNASYVIFDEVKNATDQQLKLIDTLLTSDTVKGRKLHVGPTYMDNHLTVALTAVHKTFTDETERRIARIQFTESRKSKISEFDKRWVNRGPQLLAAIVSRLAAIQIDPLALPDVPYRNRGFAVIKHAVESVFGISPDYSLHASGQNVLDYICKFFEQDPAELREKRKKGAWYQYSRSEAMTLIGRIDADLLNRNQFEDLFRTALGHGISTEAHPVYGNDGYQAESGRRYHIKWQREGDRTYIKVSPQAVEVGETGSSNTDDMKPAPPTSTVSTTNSETQVNEAQDANR